MLYQLETPLAILIIVLDLVVLGLLIKLFKRPRGSSINWLAILLIAVLTVPLTGLKFLFSSLGTVASAPGLVSIRNPEQRIVKLYYLRHYPKEAWQVEWVEYLISSDKETVLETEARDGLEVAYQQANKWHYAPIQFDSLNQTEITIPQGFTAVDTSGRIEAAVNRHILTECVSWFSNLLTFGSIGLLVALIVRLPSSKRLLAAT